MTKKILEKVLSPSEKVKYQFSIGDKYLKTKKIAMICFGSLIFFIIGSILIYLFKNYEMLIIAIIVIFWVFFVLFSFFYFGWYLKRANIYLITNKRIIIHKGWFCTRVVSVDFIQITDVKVIKPFIEKIIYKTGTLKINTAGMEIHPIILHHIENPFDIKRILNEIRFFEKNKLTENII